MTSEPPSRPDAPERRREMERARPGQVLGQALLIVLVVAIWVGLLLVFLGFISVDQAPGATALRPPAAAEAPAPTQEASIATHTLPAPTGALEVTPIATKPSTNEPSAAISSPTAPRTETESPPSSASAAGPPETAGVSFSEEVLPILTSRCKRCHGGGMVKAGLNLLSYAGVMAGSNASPVVIPGSAAKSPLVQSIIYGDMPKRAPRLPHSETQIIATWVTEGALDN